MFYLILKFTFLFALAALFGFLFGRWWARRSFMDVTHDYVAISHAAEAPWERVWQRFDALETAVGEVRSDLPAGLEVVQDNLAERVRQELSSVRSSLADVQPRPGRAAQVDLSPLEQRLTSLEDVLREIPHFSSELDLGALQAQFAERGSVNFAPIERQLSGIERSLDSLQVPDLNRWLDIVEEALRTPTADLEPIEARLTRIEHAIASSPKPTAAPRTAARARKPARRITSRGQNGGLSAETGPEADNLRLLESPQFGSKDDLKQISGVGPKLERELNSQGVYYFWQIAEWNNAEIQVMDERLTFRGRIERDDWVSQARRLMNNGNAATRPGD